MGDYPRSCQTRNVVTMMDNKQLRRWLKENGYVLELSGRGHIRVRCPQTRKFLGMVAVSPGGGCRSQEGDIATLRRNGVPIPRK